MIDRIHIHKAWLEVIEKAIPKYEGEIFGGVKIFTSEWIPNDKAILADSKGNVIKVINLGEPPKIL